ncbi:long-chain acyl-CoA synthetase [Salinibacillus kushneri]|uniref:Long-chain acyl-CoA synthetase n=1 Tax=Salinibacillus kushneri TaxID=237682 RepID=A0A1H9YY03_9BACI|nr:class I adenylate-forming enzyme family protein [Salinibacillus kushneri]SES74088.1 long-chain acyl-CoA synthetase [Salinibacillus kushneri]
MPKFWKDMAPRVHEESVHGINMKTYKERPSNLTETLSESAKQFPDKTALIHGDERITYRELQKQVNTAAYQLKQQYGVKKGDRVAFLLMNGIPFVVGVYATLKIGAIAVPLNTKLKSSELEFMLINSGAKVLMANQEWWPNIKELIDRIPVETFFITDPSPPDGTIPFSKLTNQPAEEHTYEVVHEHDPAFIMYTSGTTGRPKGALISHFNMIHTILNYKYCYNLSSNDSTVIAVPVFHITGLAAQLMTFMSLGGKMVLMPMFKPTPFLEILQNENITHVIASPTVYVMTLQEPDYQKYDVSHFRVAGFGGAPMPSETLKGLKKWVPDIELHNTYGLTETTSPVTIMPDEHQLNHVSSVGVTTPVNEARVVDPENRHDLLPGEVGELLFKGPMVIEKYWNNEKATNKSFENGWFSTGDLAVMDSEGFITIMDRIKDMVNRGGEKIFSVEVEDVLYSHQKIVEAAIVGVPDEKYGEVVKACIVLRDGASLTEEEIKDCVRNRLAKFKVPEYVEFMDVLPRNPNGKVVKTELRYIPEVSKN